MKCDIRFDAPFGKSRCVTCGRQWEAMTPDGSMSDCYRELGSRLLELQAENERLRLRCDALALLLYGPHSMSEKP